MNKYRITKLIKKRINSIYKNKKIIAIVLMISLCFSMMFYHKIDYVFAAVATYGRTDDGKWAYKILDETNMSVSIRPSNLDEMNLTTHNIPSKVLIQNKSYTVTEISSNAYFMCVCTSCLNKNHMGLGMAWEDEDGRYEPKEKEVEIAEVIIPSTITSIGESAFEFCNITNVVFEENSQLNYIGLYAFSDTTLESIIIPATVKTIEDGCFCYSDIKEVFFEEGSQIKEINPYTFEETGLKNINLPEGITRISEDAFLSCNLEKIDIPASVQTIGYSVFEANRKLKEVNFADDGALKTIRKGAFMECDLTEVSIPASVTTIGNCAFGNNDNLKTVTLHTQSDIASLNSNAFARVDNYIYDEDEIGDKKAKKNTSVTQVNVKNYDVYKWIANKNIFDTNAKVYSENTRVFLENEKENYVQGNIAMNIDGKAIVNISDYIELKQGYHFEECQFDYGNNLDLEQKNTKKIENDNFESIGYPYVIIRTKQEINEYEIIYDSNGGAAFSQTTKCNYNQPITIESNIPTRTHYEFMGWCTNSSGEGVIYQPEEIVNNNFTEKNNDKVTLYAIWKEKTKKLTIHFSTPKKKSADSKFEIIISRDGKTIQQHDVESTEVGNIELIITGAKVGETYIIKCTNYTLNDGKKKYYKTVTKQVTIS